MTDTAAPEAPVSAPVETGEKIFRVPDDPVALFELQDELNNDNINIDARIARATEQKNTNNGRLAKIKEKLDTLDVADTKIKTAVNERLKGLEDTIANLKARFNL